MGKVNPALEVLMPPLPSAALMAKPVEGRTSRGDGLEQQVADLREVVARLAGRVQQLEEAVALQQTVCCVCGKLECHEAPHVPRRYWMRFGPDSFRTYARDDREGAARSEREYYEFRQRDRYGYEYGRERTAVEARMLDYQRFGPGRPDDELKGRW